MFIKLITLLLALPIISAYPASDESQSFGPAPLQLCSKEGNQFDIKDIKLNPYPFRKGQPFTVELVGQLKTTIENGAKMNIKVKKGPFKLYDQDRALCVSSGSGGLACPVSPGFQTLSVTESIPGQAPSGQYGLTVTVSNADTNRLVCVTGNIEVA